MKKIIKSFINSIAFSDKSENDASVVIELRKKIKGKSPFLGVLLRRKYNRLCIKYGCFFPSNATIGENLILPHGLYGIFISQGAIIGDNCCIFQHVTIGSNNLNGSANTGAPTIGNNVYIGAGAKIIGKCKIGNNVRIGANTVVTKDIPDNVTVVGAECRIIEHSHILDNSFIPR